MCIWKVNAEDRHCEFCSYGGDCEQRVSLETRERMKDDMFRRYYDVMCALLGTDVLRRSRDADLVWARYLMAYKLFMGGCNHYDIARMLRVDRTTVIHGINKVSEVFKYPRMYAKEMRLWTEFTEKC